VASARSIWTCRHFSAPTRETVDDIGLRVALSALQPTVVEDAASITSQTQLFKQERLGRIAVAITRAPSTLWWTWHAVLSENAVGPLLICAKDLRLTQAILTPGERESAAPNGHLMVYSRFHRSSLCKRRATSSLFFSLASLVGRTRRSSFFKMGKN